MPASDVVVVQNRGSPCVWCNIDAPDRVTTVAIKSDVHDIERKPGRATRVVIDEGAVTTSVPLDESLIEFRAAVDRADFDGCGTPRRTMPGRARSRTSQRRRHPADTRPHARDLTLETEAM